MLIDKFRRINKKQNDYWFKTCGNTFDSYISRIDHFLPASGTILDLGAGAVTLACYLPRVRGQNVLSVATDYSSTGLIKNQSKARIVSDAERLPFEDESFDIIAASCVFEHLEHPSPVIGECFRVLKKGGALVFYTPHRRSYVATLALITPLSFHCWVRVFQTGQSLQEVEAIKTFYKINTRSALQKCQGQFRLASLEISTGAPSYTTFLPPPIHLMFIFLHKLLARVCWFRSAFGETLIGCFLKPDTLPTT